MIRLSQVRSAASQTAWKVPRMRGYMYKDVPTGAADGTFNIVFVQADGDEFVFAVSATDVITGPTVPSGQTDAVMEVTGELLSLLMSAEWSQLSKADAEAVRAPTAGREW